MQHRNTPEFKRIAALPDAVILSCFKDIYPGKPVPATKGALCDSIYLTLANNGNVSGNLDALLSRVGYVAPISRAEIEAASGLAEKAIQSCNNLQTQISNVSNDMLNIGTKLHSLGNAHHTFLQSVNGNMRTLGEEIHNLKTIVQSTVEEKVNALSAALSRTENKIDPVQIQAAIANAVSEAFGTFKQAVEKAGAQETVAALVQDIGKVAADPCKVIFGISAKDARGNDIHFQRVNHPSAPAVDQCFIWTPDILRILGAAQADGGKSTLCNVWANGEKGTGKTETARQFAARTGRPYFRINFQKFTMLEDICGSVGLNSGSTEFQPGPLLKAWSTPYAVVNLDEPSLADPGVLGFLNGLLEPGSTVYYGGKAWTRAPGVIVIASDNTNGSGDVTGRYTGTRPQSAALLDRFGFVPYFSYLPKAEEVRALVRHTGCKPELAEYIHGAISIARSKVKTGEIIDAPSIRSVVSFIRALDYMPVKDAWDMTIAARQPAESAVALEAIYQASIDANKVITLI